MGETKGTFHAKMGTIKDRQSKDLTEAEVMKKRQEYTELKKKKVLMKWIIIMVWSLTYSQTSWSVKWALGSITTNKANGGDGIPAEIFQILKDDAIKVSMTYSICSKFGKLSSGHRIEKGSFPFNPKER